MVLDDLKLNVSLDFEINFSKPHTLHLPECYPKPKTRNDKLFLELWPDQYEGWLLRKSFGRPRIITWPQLLDVVYHSVREISEGYDQEDISWNGIIEVDKYTSASQFTSRMRKYYKGGLLPTGEWKFANRSIYKGRKGYSWEILGIYIPRSISDIDEIKRIPPALRSELIRLLSFHKVQPKKDVISIEDEIFNEDLLHPRFDISSKLIDRDAWPNAKNSRGPARKPGWSVIISVVNWCINDLYEGREPQWKVIGLSSSKKAAYKAINRLQVEYAADLPKGDWKFKIGEGFANGSTQILAKYCPRKFSEVANIPGVPKETKDIWLEKLHNYAQKKIAATQDGS